MSKSRVSVDILDADGAIYNSQYHFHLVTSIVKHLDFITSRAAVLQKAKSKKSKSSAQEEPLEDVSGQVEAIIEDIIEAQRVSPVEFKQAYETVVKYADSQLDRKRQWARNRLKHLFPEEQLNKIVAEKYPDMETDKKYSLMLKVLIQSLNLIDPRLMNAVMIAANKSLISKFDLEEKEIDTRLLMHGSARQTKSADDEGVKINNTGSIFQDLTAFTGYLSQRYSDTEVVLNKLTLTDIYHHSFHGSNFDNVLEGSSNAKLHSIHDETKLTIVYAAMHDAAMRHPDTEMTVNFYDDRDDILSSLQSFFTRHPELIPENVTLHLHQYKDAFLGIAKPIQGTGQIDTEYRATVTHIASICQLQNNWYTQHGYIDAANMLTPLQLSHLFASQVKKKGRNLSILLDADGCIYNYKYSTILKSLIKQFGNEIKHVATSKDNEAARIELAVTLIRMIQEEKVDIISHKDEERLNAFLGLTMDAAFQPVDKDILSDFAVDGKKPTAVVRQFVRYLQKIDPSIIDEIIFKSNEKLFAGIVARAQAAECEYINALVGSNRQCYRDDEYNGRVNGTRSYYYDLHRLVKRLNKEYDSKMPFKLDRFLLADAYMTVPPGSSYYHALHATNEVNHPIALWDEKKVSLIYGYLHHIAKVHPNTVAVEYFDDRQDIFEAIAKSYNTDNRHTLLPTLTLNMIHYHGDEPEYDRRMVIQGSGKSDEEYANSVKIMASLCGVPSIPAINSSTVDMSTQLDFARFASLRDQCVVSVGGSLQLSAREYRKRASITQFGVFNPGVVVDGTSGSNKSYAKQLEYTLIEDYQGQQAAEDKDNTLGY